MRSKLFNQLLCHSKLLRRLILATQSRNTKQLARGKTKIFCIGRNITATTSIKQAFIGLGFPVGNQRFSELYAKHYYFDNNFDPIVEYCISTQVFQDAPFSWAETFKHQDCAYHGSKIILTIRHDAAQWYQTITRFHAKHFGSGHIPTASDLSAANYVCEDFMYSVVNSHGSSDDDIYNKEIVIAHYNHHNQTVLDYFHDRPRDLLVINLAEKSSYQKFVDFLGIDSPFRDFPWENRTT